MKSFKHYSCLIKHSSSGREFAVIRSLILAFDILGLCWRLEDVAYLKKNHRKEETKSKLTPEARAALQEWLWADYKLYDHFKAEMERKVADFGAQAMDVSLSRLRILNGQLREACVIREAGKDDLKGNYQDNSPVVLGYQVHEDKEVCSEAAFTERAFIERIKVAQTRRVKNIEKEN